MPPNYINNYFNNNLYENKPTIDIIKKINCMADTYNNIKKQFKNDKNKLLLLKSNLREFNKNNCSICCDNRSMPTFMSCCNKIFCFNCITG